MFSGDEGADKGGDAVGDAVGKEKEVMLNSSSNRKEGNGEKGVIERCPGQVLHVVCALNETGRRCPARVVVWVA